MLVCGFWNFSLNEGRCVQLATSLFSVYNHAFTVVVGILKELALYRMTQIALPLHVTALI